MAKVAQGVGKQAPRVAGSRSWRALWGLSVMLELLPLLWLPVSQGQTTSITNSNTNLPLNSPENLGTVINRNGTTTTIESGTLTTPSSIGKRNLFHSFGDFSVGPGHTAEFMNNRGTDIVNIISRVTGGITSDIQGTVKITGFENGPTLWLINPAGILLGPHAQLINVGGSIHLSTADYLKVTNETNNISSYFYASLAKNSTLTSGPVTAFGFLGETHGRIDIQGRADGFNLVPDAQRVPISFVGGDISIQSATIAAPAGPINLVSLRSGEFLRGSGFLWALGGINEGAPKLSPESVPGTIRLNGASVSVTNQPGSSDQPGNIFIRSGQLVMEGTTISAGPESGAGFPVQVRGGNIALVADNINVSNSTIDSHSTGTRDAGTIVLTGQNIALNHSTLKTEGSALKTEANNSSGGDISLSASNTVRLVNTSVTTSVFGPENTHGGNITIDTVYPQFVILQGNSQLLAQAFKGRGGNITIGGGVVLQEPGSVITASSALGISGTVNIQAPIQQLAGAIAPLPQAFAVATNLYGQRCAAEKGGQFSSFVQGARDGVPPQPGDLIRSPLMLELDEVSFGTSSQAIPSLAAIRLGLPEFDQMPHSLTVFAGCRS